MNKKARECLKELYDLRLHFYMACKDFFGEEEVIELFEDYDKHFDSLSDCIQEVSNEIYRWEFRNS